MNPPKIPPHIFAAYHREITACIQALQARDELPSDLNLAKITVDPPREAAHGELSTNAAMVLAKEAKLPPKILAEKIGTEMAARARYPITDWSVMGPGFLNWRLNPQAWHQQLLQILTQGSHFGESQLGDGKKINVEFVSANPTGPLHVANARGAVFGDVLARILTKCGFDVTREYYVNDAGSQIFKLYQSLFHRYQELLGVEVGALPADCYPGEYVIEIAKEIIAKDDHKWLTAPENERERYFRQFALDKILAMIMADLALLGVKYDHIQFESDIISRGRVDQAIENLTEKSLIYQGVLERPKGKPDDDWEEREQILFKSTAFGDDQDRALKKSDGSYTYFAVDIAYHWYKLDRKYTELVNVWGADHIGYVKRLTAAVKALSQGRVALDVKICQLVTLLNHGVPVKMSKRSGNFIRLAELVEEVGSDVVRFIMLTRRNDAALEFDFAKVVEQSRENPVFYVQYAHARAASVLRSAAEMGVFPVDGDPAAIAKLVTLDDLAVLDHEEELALIREIARFPRIIEEAATAHEPHRLAFYLGELAASFHHLWTRGRDDATMRFIQSQDAANQSANLARLAMVAGLKQTLAIGLAVLGITAKEEMR
ncbi:MAG: arginine--tRNA ligase [Candidatus Symbiobacter sp.]|nr:arginine--tRNA ligase [Candidatus Symbiobacter sp.]